MNDVFDHLLSLDFEIKAGKLYRIEHRLGSLQVSISTFGVIRIDGFSTSEKHLITGQIQKRNGNWISKLSSNGRSTSDRYITWYNTQDHSEEVAYVTASSMCGIIMTRLVDELQLSLNVYDEQCRENHKNLKKIARETRQTRLDNEREEVLKSHRFITPHEIERHLKYLKAIALSESSYGYLTLKSLSGSLTVGCEGTSTRVSWYLNGSKISHKDLVSIMSKSVLLELHNT